MDSSPERAGGSNQNTAANPLEALANAALAHQQPTLVNTTEAGASNFVPTTQRRRRRLLSRLSRNIPEVRLTTNNPFGSESRETSPTTPAVRMPSKRKASSSAKSGKLIAVSDAFVSTSTDQPIVKFEDLFGNNDSSRPTTQDSSVLNSVSESSDEDSELFELSIQRFDAPDLSRFPGRGPRDFANLWEMSRARTEAAKRDEASRKLSAMLVYNNNDTGYEGSPLGPATVNHNRAHYLPLCRAPSAQAQPAGGYLTILQSHRTRIQRSECTPLRSTATWPMDELPVELFDLITAFLARDDVKSMRLVNREFERKVSRRLFQSSVVPFNTELYDMIDDDKKTSGRSMKPKYKGKGKMKAMSRDILDAAPDVEVGGLNWQNAMDDREGKVYKGHGLKVFQGFGPHIKRFGMTFEVAEKQLSNPPIKKELDHVESYHGTYDWPSQHYTRFANLAGLENTADETSRMKAAFGNLEKVQELGLSIDSGLGWLNGPDKSMRGRIFEHPSAVFGSAYDVPDHASQAANEFWDALQQSHMSFAPRTNIKEVTLDHRALPLSPTELDGLCGQVYSDTHLWSAIDRDKFTPFKNHSDVSGFGVVYTTVNQQISSEIASEKLPLVPCELRKEQKEWLLETQWAQQAFLESYLLAVVDNSTIFEKVTTLNVAKLSSRFLPMLAREVFWDALPCLSDVTLHVSADWRSVEKDEAGFAETRHQNPSDAVRMYYKDVLRDHICMRESIKKLNVGWVGGGELAEGMFARNCNLLPAPITQLEHCTANSNVFGLVFKNVEHLTLSNCWITPPTLEGFVKSHSSSSLKKLTLDSVSLTAHPRFPVNGQGGQNIAQALVAWHAQLGQQPPNLHQQQQLQGLAHQAVQMGGLGIQAPNINHFALQHIQQQTQQHLVNLNPNMAAQFAQLPLNAVVPVPPALNAPNPNPTHWTNQLREGSWPYVLDIISPGVCFQDYATPPAPWEEPLPPRAETNLQTIELISCGYAKLDKLAGGFDQTVLEPDFTNVRTMSQWFRTRYSSLKPAMLTTSDRYLGQIVQFIPPRETYAMLFAWGLVEGWDDRAKAEEAEFDGCLPGGTGRVSGVIDRDSPIRAQPEARD